MHKSFLIIAVLSSLLIQACATTNVVTTTIQGKELSRTSLGVREIDNRVIMEEVAPLSVKLYRRVSSVEYTTSVFQAVNETRHEKTTYDCSNAYARYPAFLLTTMGVSLLYEMATGFDFLKGMCEKNPPTYIIETAETDKTLTKESFDKEKIVTREALIAGEPVTVEIDGNKFVVSTSAGGIATIPDKEIIFLNDSERSRSIDYQYNDVRLATPFKKRAQQTEAPVAKSSDKSMPMNTALSDDSSALSKPATADITPAVKRSVLWESKTDPVAMVGEKSTTIESAKENKRQGQGEENSSSNLNGVASQLNKPAVPSAEFNNMAQNTGPTTVAGTGTGVATGAVIAINAATVTVPATVAADATTEAPSVTVTNTDEGTGTGEFMVIASPTVTSTSPNNMARGTGPTTVTIRGTGFGSGATVAFSGTGVTSGAVTVVNDTTITVPVTVAAGASTKARTVTVTNTDTGTRIGTGVFNVNPSPIVTSTSPNNMAQGTGPTTVTITGTGFVSGATVAFNGTGVTAGAVTVVNATTITVPVMVAPGVSTGARIVSVRNADTGTGIGVFKIDASPTATSTLPDNMAQGSAPTAVTGTGTGLVGDATIASSTTAVTTGAATAVSAKTTTATVATGESTGAQNVTATNTDTGTGTGEFTVNASPTATSTSPNNMADTAPTTGTDTRFVRDAAIASSATTVTTGTVSKDTEETAGMKTGSKELAAGSNTAAGNEASVSIGSESTTDSSKTDEWKIILHVNFDKNKATIKKEYFSRLKEIGDTLTENPRLKGVIEGHTDSTGGRIINQKISIHRAEAVAQYLIKSLGISPDRLRIEGYGMSRPIADNTTPKGRARNRRIEAKFKSFSSASTTSAP